MEGRTIRIGVDVGGTNTDICAIDEATGELMVYKLPSSLYDQSAAVVEGVKVIAEANDFSGSDVSRFMHGTTVATNAILEGRGARYNKDGLDAEAKKWNTRPGILLMLDVGDLREGVDSIPTLVELAKLCESLPHLRLRGVGTNLACMNGVLPTEENLSFLVEGAEAVEAAIGRKLEIISGGSSINLLLLKDGISRMPKRINHLRLGGSIANPMNIRMNRGVTFPGLREDTMVLTAEIIEIQEKASAPKQASTKNWAGQSVVREDKGRRLRAILALGSQDIGDAATLIPLDSGVEIVGCSSDHTIVDVTDSKVTWKSGDTLSFKVRYANMLYAFSGNHVNIAYHDDL